MASQRSRLPAMAAQSHGVIFTKRRKTGGHGERIYRALIAASFTLQVRSQAFKLRLQFGDARVGCLGAGL
jgi:hypothetical protein